jgi:multidrug efflux pump subunit AcrA (membrane-fusion protein)
MPAAGVLVLAGWTAVRAVTGDDSSASAQSGEQIVEATVGPMAQTVTAEGQVTNAETDELSFSAAGTVSTVNVTAGQAVTAGEVLAVLDSPELAASVADAEASVADAEAALGDDQAAGASSAQIAADESALTAAQDQLDAANEALAGAQLVATFDGVVTSVDVVAGEQLGDGGTSGTSTTGSESGSGESGGTLGDGGGTAPGGLDQGTTGSDGTDTSSPHVTVVSGSRFTVELGFDDVDVENLEAGQAATVTLSSSSSSGFPGGGTFPGGGELPGGGTFPGGGQLPEAETEDDGEGDVPSELPTIAGVGSADGTVAEVGQVADASSGVAEYPVTVIFEDTSGDYNAGATVSIEITYAETADVVQVPTLAVTTTDGEATVTVDSDGSRQTRTVTTGLSSGGMVEITSGLEAGEQVVVSRPGAGQGGGNGGGGPPGGFPGSGEGGGGGE